MFNPASDKAVGPPPPSSGKVPIPLLLGLVLVGMAAAATSGYALGSARQPGPVALILGKPDAVTIARYGPNTPGSLGASRNPDRVMTITDTKEVAKLASDANSLPPFPKGGFACPNSDGSYYQVRFAFKNGDLRTLFVDRTGCQGVGFDEQRDYSVVWSMTDHRFLDDLDALLG